MKGIVSARCFMLEGVEFHSEDLQAGDVLVIFLLALNGQ